MSSGMPSATGEATDSGNTASTDVTSGVTYSGLPSAEQFKNSLTKITAQAEISEALEFCKELSEREAQREASFESKAVTLVGFGALAATFVSGFAGLLLDDETAPCVDVVHLLAAAYALFIFSFVVAVVFALVAMWPPKTADPHPKDILDLAQSEPNLTTVRRERAVDFYKSYLETRGATRKKGFCVKVAQIGVAVGMVSLLFIACVLAVHLICG